MANAFNKVNAFVQDVGSKLHNLGSDTLNFYLTNTAPTATTTAYSTTGEPVTGGGYTAGGAALSGVTWTNASGTSSLKASNLTFTATTGFGPFRYAVLYNATAAGKNVIGWYDYNASISLGAAETFTIDVTTNTSILTLV